MERIRAGASACKNFKNTVKSDKSEATNENIYSLTSIGGKDKKDGQKN